MAKETNKPSAEKLYNAMVEIIKSYDKGRAIDAGDIREDLLLRDIEADDSDISITVFLIYKQTGLLKVNTALSSGKYNFASIFDRTSSSVAHFSGILKRGVVYTNKGTYIIEVEKMYKPEKAGNTHLGMWLQGPDDIQAMEAGDYPFIEVYNKMKEATGKFQ